MINTDWSDFEVSGDGGMTWRKAQADEVSYDEKLNIVVSRTGLATRGVIRQSWSDERPSFILAAITSETESDVAIPDDPKATPR